MNAWKVPTLILLFTISQTFEAPAAGGGSAARVPLAKRLFAAVFLVRGSVSGSSTGSFGLFVREANDSTWRKITRSNTFSFGLGYFERGATRRYYLAAGNGLHRSTDGGNTWRILTSWKTEEILNVSPDPVDSAVMYVATPFGVFRTTDDGMTWKRRMNGFRKWFIQKILLDQRDRSVLYAASEDDLYRTPDAGDHWNALNVGAAPVLAVLQRPAHPSTLIVGIEDGGVRLSSDGGAHWQQASGLDQSSVYTFRASNDGSDIYAGGWHTGLWRSEDGGLTWRPVWTDPDLEAIYSIFVDPEDSEHLLVGTAGAGVYESVNRGKAWKKAGLSGAEVKQIEAYP